MLECPGRINILKYKNNGYSFIYDLDSKIFMESSELLDNIFELIPGYSRDAIIARLSERYAHHDILAYLSELDTLYGSRTLASGKTRNKVLANLWLNVAHDCNMRCLYCFGGGGHYGGTERFMTEETAGRCIDYWYAHSGGVPESLVSFFGGEPLLNPGIILYTVEYMNKLLKEDKRRIHYEAATNGTIFHEKLAAIFAAHDGSLKISIDGKPEIQDGSRPFLSGKGTYSTIAANVARFRKYFKKLIGSIVLTRQTIPYMKESVFHLWDMGFTDVNTYLVIDAKNDFTVREEDLQLLWPQIEELNSITFKNLLNHRRQYYTDVFPICRRLHRNSPQQGCSFQGDFTIMFTPEGNIFKCYKLVDNPGFGLGSINNPLPWTEMNRDFVPPLDERICRTCEAAPLCGGGCAYESFVYHGNFSTPCAVSCVYIKFQVQQAFQFYTNLYLTDSRLPERLFGKTNQRKEQ